MFNTRQFVFLISVSLIVNGCAGYKTKEKPKVPEKSSCSSRVRNMLVKLYTCCFDFEFLRKTMARIGPIMKYTGGKAIKLTMCTGATIGGTYVILPLAGFGPHGVKRGSPAAKVHSAFGCVQRNTFFSSLQSAGVAGIGQVAKSAVVVSCMMNEFY